MTAEHGDCVRLIEVPLSPASSEFTLRIARPVWSRDASFFICLLLGFGMSTRFNPLRIYCDQEETYEVTLSRLRFLLHCPLAGMLCLLREQMRVSDDDR